MSCPYDHTAYHDDDESGNIFMMCCEDGSKADAKHPGKAIAVIACLRPPHSDVVQLWFETEMQRHKNEAE